ncbi:hypothetical protein [Canibacter zhuwentaonis]|nr:hypothetical protein [Canibacter zhuwentaonis]
MFAAAAGIDTARGCANEVIADIAGVVGAVGAAGVAGAGGASG